jgi:hypothetical protein
MITAWSELAAVGETRLSLALLLSRLVERCEAGVEDARPSVPCQRMKHRVVGILFIQVFVVPCDDLR